MSNAKKKSGTSVGKVVAVSVGIAAVSAAAYLLLGPNGKKNRKNMKAWMLKMKAEIAEKLENIQEVTAPIYEKIVHDVASKYEKVKNIDPKDLQDEIAHLKKEWKNIAKTKGKKAVSKAKKAVTKKK